MANKELIGKPPTENSCELFVVRLEGYIEWSSAKTVSNYFFHYQPR